MRPHLESPVKARLLCVMYITSRERRSSHHGRGEVKPVAGNAEPGFRRGSCARFETGRAGELRVVRAGGQRCPAHAS